MFALELALSGLAVGCVAALSGVGLIATYRVTGVFNLAFGAIAMLSAYLLWQAVRVWNLPAGPAAAVDLLVVTPGVGLLLDVLVFRPLRRRRASPVEQLVAALGVFVLVVGVATLAWGAQTRLDAPSILPSRQVRLGGGLSVGSDTLAELGIVLLLMVLLAVLLRATRVGLLVRAVVDRRELAELAGVRADRLTAAGWAFGAFLAGLTGVLLAPVDRLDPYGFTLIVLETVGVAVVARLSSLPVAVLTAFVLGIGQSELTQVHLAGAWNTLLAAVRANLFVVALLLALLVVPRLGASDAGVASRFATRRITLPDAAPQRGWWLPLTLLLLLPFAFDPLDLQAAQAVPALAVIFVSLVVVTGYSGQISLGQTAYAGLGALFAAKLAGGGLLPHLAHLPWLLAMFLGPLLVVPVGFVTGWPAIRRRGLYLALTTFAVAAVVSRFVFEQPVFTNDLTVNRPGLFTGDHAFYLLELCCLGLALLLVQAVHTGPLGRALLAIRDSEPGARAAGIDVNRLKIFVFALSAGLAGLGGVLAAMSTRSFDATAFDPVRGMIWLAAVVVCGADSAAAAVLAAAGMVALDTGTIDGASALAVGVGAVLLGRMPGGFAQLVRRVAARLAPAPPAAPRARTAVATGGAGGAGGANASRPRALSPAGRALAARLATARAARAARPGRAP